MRIRPVARLIEGGGAYEKYMRASGHTTYNLMHFEYVSAQILASYWLVGGQ